MKPLFLMIFHTGDSAEMDENYMTIVRGSSAGNSETVFTKTFPGKSIFVGS
jgi:hypothetical protein